MKSVIVITLFALIAGAGCADASDERTERDLSERAERDAAREERSRTDREDPENLGEAMQELGKVLGELGGTIGGEAAVTPVDFRELRELIPDRVRGMEQTANSGERAGALGIKISTVERTFQSSDGEEEIALKLTDLGSLKNAATLGLNWLHLDVDREDDNGFERTREFKGHPAHETCTSAGDSDRCSMHVLVAERFVLELEGRGVDIDKLRDVAGDVDIKQLDKMRYDGVKDVD